MGLVCNSAKRFEGDNWLNVLSETEVFGISEKLNCMNETWSWLPIVLVICPDFCSV